MKKCYSTSEVDFNIFDIKSWYLFINDYSSRLMKELCHIVAWTEVKLSATCTKSSFLEASLRSLFKLWDHVHLLCTEPSYFAVTLVFACLGKGFEQVTQWFELWRKIIFVYRASDSLFHMKVDFLKFIKIILSTSFLFVDMSSNWVWKCFSCFIS